MGLNRPTQQLRRQLLDMSLHQRNTLFAMLKALRSHDGMEMLILISDLYQDADILDSLADEVKNGKIERKKVDASGRH